MVEHICTICHYEGKPRKIPRGSRGMELFLWLVLLIPGPPYSIYRRFFLRTECPNCKAPGKMVSLNSDAGMVLQRMIDAELGLITPRHSAPVVLSDASHSRSIQAEAEIKQPERPREKRVVNPDEW